ncbi:MAG: lysophospholipase [Coriobacteriia bacterium]|nr:lysophospholipase [Coriobacteriia bacterium]
MIEENIIIGEGTDWPLDGMLTVPDADDTDTPAGAAADTPVPAVVLVQGSGPSNMNEEVCGRTPFKDIAHGLAQRGIATIRFDKRTFTYGKQLAKKRDISVKDEYIDDVLYATQLLRDDPRIDSNRIFIAGHSLGAMVAPRIDQEGGNYAGLILMAGAIRRLEDVMATQIAEQISDSKWPMTLILRNISNRMQKKLKGIYEMSDEKAKNTKVFGNIYAYYFKDLGKKQVSEYLADTTKPVLVLHGEKDFQVTVEDDFEGFKKSLAHNPQASFKLYPNLNHLFMPSIYGTIKMAKKEYSVPAHVEGYVIADIAAWIDNIS